MCKKASDEVMTGQAEKGLHRGRGKRGCKQDEPGQLLNFKRFSIKLRRRVDFFAAFLQIVIIAFAIK